MSEYVPQNDFLSSDEFPKPTYDDWYDSAVATLKGASFEKALTTPTYEGITLRPLYHRQDAANIDHRDTLPEFFPFVRGTSAAGYVSQPWRIAQTLPYPTPEAFNTALRHDLAQGQDSIHVVLDQPTRIGLDPDQSNQAGQGGLSLASVSDLQQALDSIDLTAVPIVIQSGTSALALTALLAAYLEMQVQQTAPIQGDITADPLGELVVAGTLPLPLENAYDEMAQLTAWVQRHGPQIDTIAVSTEAYHNSGGHAVQELAFAIATGAEYLRAMRMRHLSIDAAASRFRFHFAVGSQFFTELAKLRAARMLWSQVVAAFGGSTESQNMKIHAVTGGMNKTTPDSHANVLRTTLEAFAAALGGVDSMDITPFDAPFRPPDDFSRRIARNQQSILQHETNLTHVIDPAGGSWYIETLTDWLARQAWSLFQEIERQGGMYAALDSGFIQDQIAQIAAQRSANIEQRKDVLIGINMYGNASEGLPEADTTDWKAVQKSRTEQFLRHKTATNTGRKVNALAELQRSLPDKHIEAAIEASRAGATLNEITCHLRAGYSDRLPAVNPVQPIRLAEAFEELRRNAESYRVRTGYAPQIFLANIGNYRARAEFTTGFFEVGGFEIVNEGRYETPEAAAQAALHSDTPVVVICSTDDTYPQIVPPLVSQIKAARPGTIVILAGYPQDQVEAHRAAGVDEFIHIRANCYTTNRKLQQMIGVIR